MNTAFKNRYFILAISLVALITIALTAKPVYRELRKMRARSFVSQAMELAKQGSLRESLDKATAAARLGLDDPETLRPLARFESEVGMPDALKVWQALIDTGKSTVSDRIDYARMALSLDKLEIASRISTELLADYPQETDTHLLAAELQAGNRKPEAAEAALRLGLKFKPDDPQLSNSLGRLLMSFQQIEKTREVDRREKRYSDRIEAIPGRPPAGVRKEQRVAEVRFQQPAGKSPEYGCGPTEPPRYRHSRLGERHSNWNRPARRSGWKNFGHIAESHVRPAKSPWELQLEAAVAESMGERWRRLRVRIGTRVPFQPR